MEGRGGGRKHILVPNRPRFRSLLPLPHLCDLVGGSLLPPEPSGRNQWAQVCGGPHHTWHTAVLCIILRTVPGRGQLWVPVGVTCTHRGEGGSVLDTREACFFWGGAFEGEALSASECSANSGAHPPRQDSPLSLSV